MTLDHLEFLDRLGAGDYLGRAHDAIQGGVQGPDEVIAQALVAIAIDLRLMRWATEEIAFMARRGFEAIE